MTRTVGLICARSGSKGIQRKNLRLLAGKPLVVWSVDVALACSMIDQVYISTDDPEIAQVAERAGAIVPFLRPKELATDTSPEWEVWRHFILSPEVSLSSDDVVVSVSPTAPLRAVDDLGRAIALVQAHEAEMVVGVTPARRHPAYNLLKRDEVGAARPYISEVSYSRRQDCPPAWDLTTVVYAARAEYILTHDSLFGGRVKTVEIPAERALDIDTEFDLKLAELLVARAMF